MVDRWIVPFLFTFLSFLSAAQTDTAYIQKFERALDYTAKVAHSMPDSLYDFRPTDEVFTFGKQLHHGLNTVLRHYHNYYLKSSNAQRSQVESSSQKEVTLLIDSVAHTLIPRLKSMDAEDWQEPVEFFSGTFPAKRFFQVLLDHLTHHRAMAIVYLRLNGIPPPRYIGW